jgi:hypothetical protein
LLQASAASTASQSQQEGGPLAAAPGALLSRSRARCCALTLLVCGLLVAGVLVPVAVTVGLKPHIRPTYRVLTPPAPTPRLLLAFEGGALVARPADVLPPHLAAGVVSWAALPSSGLHVATFAGAGALQQVLAALAARSEAAADAARRGDSSARGARNSSSRDVAGGAAGRPVLRYAVSDFQLLPDRQLRQLVDPMALFEQAKEQRRRLASQVDTGWDTDDVYLLQGGNGSSRPREQQQSAGTWDSSSSSSTRAGARRRRRMLLQTQQQSDSAAAAPGAPPRRPLQLQAQQRQAQYHVQRGGGAGVAWHLLDDALGVRTAWSATTGARAGVFGACR